MEALSFEFEGMPVRYYRAGRGVPLLLLHGSGPGASSIGNWRPIFEPLAAHFEVFAMDLIGFGESARKPAAPYFDYPLWLRQAGAMLARLPGQRVGLLAHSLSASIALQLAAAQPDKVAGVVTTGAMGAAFAPNDATRRIWRCPTNRDELRQALQSIIFDHSQIDDAYLAAREPVVFAPGYAAYFDAMFAGDPAQYVNAALVPAAVLASIECPVLMLHGRDDAAFPPESSLQLARGIADADVMVLARCSHSIALERSSSLLALARHFFDTRLEGVSA